MPLFKSEVPLYCSALPILFHRTLGRTTATAALKILLLLVLQPCENPSYWDLTTNPLNLGIGHAMPTNPPPPNPTIRGESDIFWGAFFLEGRGIICILIYIHQKVCGEVSTWNGNTLPKTNKKSPLKLGLLPQKESSTTNFQMRTC